MQNQSAMLGRAVAACVVLLLTLACQPAAVLSPPPPTPLTPTFAPTQPPPTVAPIVVPPTPTSVGPAALPTSKPTPPPPTPTLRPTIAPTPQPTATPDPTPDLDRAQQQLYCDTAAPPAHIALPPIAPRIHIPPPSAQTEPTAVANGPRRDLADPAPVVTAGHVAILDETSGALLYSVDAYTRQAPASITKIATAIVALERGPNIKKTYVTTVSATALINCDGSSVMGLEPNDHVSLETLLYGMMLPSGNDAAEQIAYSLAGSREAYVAWMNDKVASLGLRDTHFVTPSGMDADDHYSSAYDMALLARYAMRNPEFRTLVSTVRFVGDDYYLHNINPLLGSYAGADGVKVGYTEIARRTIVASATRNGHRVYVALMGSRNLAGDCVALFDWVWKAFRW